MNFDVIVVGGGPGGALSSAILSKKGYKVLLIEAGSYKRYKVCSGGTPLRSVKLISEFGNPFSIVERDINSVGIYISDKDKIYSKKNEIIGYTYYRSEFDQWIRDKAHDNGVEVVYNTSAKKILIDNQEVKIKCNQKGFLKEYKSKLLIGAFGIRPDLISQLGLEKTEYLISVQSEFFGDISHVDEELINCFSFFVDSRFSTYSYGWIFPKKEGLSIGITDRIEGNIVIQRFKKFISKHPIVSKQVKGMKIMPIYGKEILAHLNPNKPLKRTYGKRFVVIGDAAGFADPVTWEGIYFSLKSGEIAANTFSYLLNKGIYSEKGTKIYEKNWKKEFGKTFEIEYAVKQLLWGKDLEKKWLTIIDFFRKNEKLNKILKEELVTSMSIAPVIKRMSTINKLKIGFKLKGYKLLRNPSNFIYVFKTLFS